MTLEEIRKYQPQRTFLIQGSEGYYDNLLAEALAVDPMLFSFSAPRLTMDHARSIVSFILEGTGQDRLCIVHFTVFSPDAAQVLLKALEEPDEYTTVIFVTSYPYLVPQTIRSRIMLMPGDREASLLPVGNKESALAYIKKEFDAEIDDAATRRAKAVMFLDALEEKIRKSPERAKALYEAKHMLFAANMPTKYVLEYAVSMTL